MTERVLVTGADGLVGSRFCELAPRSFELVTPSQKELDITNLKKVDSFFRRNSFTFVVNFAAFTDVNAAEGERGKEDGLCFAVNVKGVKNLVSKIDPSKTFFAEVSTDMSGLKGDGPFKEDQLPQRNKDTVTWYGFTKGEGEWVVIDEIGLENAAILRLIYPVRARFEKKSDYLRKPLQLFDQGKLYKVFNNQEISLTFIDEAVQALVRIMETRQGGIFHASSPDTTTPYEIISYLIQKARGATGVVESQTVEEFIEKTGLPFFRYPKKESLSVGKTEKRLGIKFSTWREIVDELIRQGIKP